MIVMLLYIVLLLYSASYVMNVEMIVRGRPSVADIVL